MIAEQHLADYDLGFVLGSKQIEENLAVPLLSSGEDSEGPLAEGCCPVCHHALLDSGDPATATSPRDFLRRSHAADPHRYHAALKANPVNANVARDEKSHELHLDATVTSDGELTIADREAYRSWLRQQFR